jgi:hypothetical protein
MRAWTLAHRRSNAPSKRKKRKWFTRTAPPPPPPSPPRKPDIHFEAGWTDSWGHRRCMHEHESLIEAAKCGSQHGCGWYVFAVEKGEARPLSIPEDEIVNPFRFGISP